MRINEKEARRPATSTLAPLLRVCRDHGYGGFSTDEPLSRPWVLNGADWLGEFGCTIDEALDRLGPD